jgi:hypothetical protein
MTRETTNTGTGRRGRPPGAAQFFGAGAGSVPFAAIALDCAKLRQIALNSTIQFIKLIVQTANFAYQARRGSFLFEARRAGCRFVPRPIIKPL